MDTETNTATGRDQEQSAASSEPEVKQSRCQRTPARSTEDLVLHHPNPLSRRGDNLVVLTPEQHCEEHRRR